LKKHGIIKSDPKPEAKEEEPEVCTLEKKLLDINSEDDLLDLDESDEYVMREYRNRRMAEMRAKSLIPTFGDVREITASDYVQQVNGAGHDIEVVQFLYQSGYVLLTTTTPLTDHFIDCLFAVKYPRMQYFIQNHDRIGGQIPEHQIPEEHRLAMCGQLPRQRTTGAIPL